MYFEVWGLFCFLDLSTFLSRFTIYHVLPHRKSRNVIKLLLVFRVAMFVKVVPFLKSMVVLMWVSPSICPSNTYLLTKVFRNVSVVNLFDLLTFLLVPPATSSKFPHVQSSVHDWKHTVGCFDPDLSPADCELSRKWYYKQGIYLCESFGNHGNMCVTTLTQGLSLMNQKVTMSSEVCCACVLRHLFYSVKSERSEWNVATTLYLP